MQTTDEDLTWNEIAELQKSDNWDERFKAEFYSLQKRMLRLDNMLYNWRNGRLKFIPKCSYQLLQRQFDSMLDYYSILLKRAKIEEVDINDIYA